MRTLDLLSGTTLSYSQNREDIILEGFFKQDKKGFYVDVGANEPDRDSVTRIFYEKGWSGINIEPIRIHHKQLQEKRPRDINLNIGIASKAGKLKLRQYAGSGLSTFSAEMQKQYEKTPNVFTKQYEDYQVETKTLKQIFKDHKISKIDFMKVDVEGFEHEVLISNDWDKYRPRVLCIEANHIENDWRPLLLDSNYSLVFFDGLNEYYIDKYCSSDLLEFSYVNAVLDRKPIVDYLVLDKLNKWVDTVNAETNENETKIALLNSERKKLQEDVSRITKQYEEIASLNRHIKKFIRQKISSLDAAITKKLVTKVPFEPDIPHFKVSDDLFIIAKESDVKNYNNYTFQAKQDLRFKIYSRLRTMATKSLRLGK